MKLKQLIFAMFRTRYERENRYQEFTPYFYRFIGVETEEDYYDALRTLKEKKLEHSKLCLLFDGEIELKAELELIHGIHQELGQMDVFNLASQEISVFEKQEVNQLFLQALEKVVRQALAQETFFSDSVRNDFIAKLIVWAFSYVRDLTLDDLLNPKCLYYGNIQRHEIYFLMLLYQMGFDVIYLNPLKEEGFEEIDRENVSHQEREMGILAVETFEAHATKGSVFTQIESSTKLLQQEIHEQLFDGTGIYQPWQFRGGYTKSLVLDTLLDDVLVYWGEEARFREGFKVVGDVVHVPCFFYKVDGLYQDAFQYQNLLKHCAKAPHVHLTNQSSFVKTEVISDDKYQLMFCQLSDGTFDADKIRELPFYRLQKYSIELQTFLLKKMNEVIQGDLFEKPLTQEELMDTCYLIITLDDSIIRLIDNFDYTGQIPKLVIYLEGEQEIPDELVYVLGYLNKIGLDIMIFNPSGLFNIYKILKPTQIITKRLETMVYDSTYSNVMSLRKGFLSKLLNK